MTKEAQLPDRPRQTTVRAIYQGGKLTPQEALNLEEGEAVDLVVVRATGGEAAQPDGKNHAAIQPQLRSMAGAGGLTRTYGLFGAGILVYLLTRFIGLGDFPIYFFGDEASQTLFAERLIASGFRDAKGVWFPMYVEAAALRWTPLLSMYFHAAALTVFGKSVLVTRGVSALVSILAGIAVSLALKEVFKARYWWAGMLLVGLTPGWFLHSRTAFETVMTTAFYAMFGLCYLLYRTRSPRYLYAALVFGAMTFYTYSNAQAVMAAAGLLLLVTDFRYHWQVLRQERKTLLWAGGLVILLVLPFLAFRFTQPEAMGEHLRMINSYWVQPIPLGDKLGLFLQKYAYGLSPQYWFFPNGHDLPRHRMAGMGQMATWTLPLFLIGAGIALWRVRNPAYRGALMLLLATPVGASLLEIGIPRVLSFIVPANILVGLGLEWVLTRLEKWIPQNWASAGVGVALIAANVLLLRTALIEGPLWFDDYGLYGMQYGARQLFEEQIPEILRQDAETEVLVTSTWANGTDNFLNFFLTAEQRQRVRMDGIARFLFRQTPLTRNMLFVMTQSEFQKVENNPKFTNVSVEKLIPYPNGKPGFYFVRLEYSQAAEAIFAAEQAERRKLAETRLVVEGQPVQLKYSQIDMGAPELMFDGDEFTLMRGMEANPYILEFIYDQARPVSGLELNLGLVDVRVTVTLFPEDGGPPVTYSATRERSNDPSLKVEFEQAPALVRQVRIEILNLYSGETANIHIRELRLLR